MYTAKQPNLQQMSMVSIGQCVWQTPLVKRHIKELFSSENGNGYEMSRYVEWINTAREIYSKLKKDLLPLRLTNELLYVVKQMGDHMYDWYHYVERMNRFFHEKCGQKLQHPDKIYWLASGAINVERVIFENWIKNVTLENACAVYFLSIIHGLDKCRAYEVWSLMPTKLKITSRQILSCKESYASAFLYTCIGDPNESLEIAKKLGYTTVEHRQRFLLFVGKGYIELMKSVWFQLSGSARNSLVDKGFRLALRRSSSFSNRRFEKRRCDEIALFLYCQMNDQHRHNIFYDTSSNHYAAKLLYIVASRPHLDLLMPILQEILKYTLVDVDYVYSELVNSLIYDMLEDFDCTYVPRGTLVKVWKRIPVEIKRDIQFDEVIDGLIDEWDLISLRILMNIPELAHEKEQFRASLVHSYLKLASREGFDRLNELAQKVFLCHSDIDNFIRRVEDCKAIGLLRTTDN